MLFLLQLAMIKCLMKNIKVIWLFKVWKFSIEIKLSSFAHTCIFWNETKFLTYINQFYLVQKHKYSIPEFTGTF